MESKSTKIIAQTAHLRLVQNDGWSYIQRTNASGVVGIIAVTNDQKLILVDQFRTPAGTHVIELPAGLAGDIPEFANEPLESAARRELLEETGYEAEKWEQIINVTSSAGLTDETTTLFFAHGLKKIADGGGDASEQITIHEIPLAHIDSWLSEIQSAGKLIDSRVFAALYLLNSQR